MQDFKKIDQTPQDNNNNTTGTSSTGTSLNMSELARSPYGDLELTKYLYESGLQNIFNTYQQNVANLSQNKQQELQDAYYIREMSKKYLGEYASNVGVGDVSGNLLDIYGQYQSNLTDIERNYDQLQMGLDQQYQQQRTEQMNNILLADYNIELAKFQEGEKNVLFNVEMGTIPGGVSAEEYLQTELQSGNISQTAYQEALRVVQQQNFSDQERQLWGQLVRGEMTKEELTAAYEAGQISQEAYGQFFTAMEQEERANALYNIEYNIVRSDFGGFNNVEDYLQNQLDTGAIDQTEFQDLMLKYSENPMVTAARDVEFNIANNSLPEGMNAKEYIQSEYDAGNISQEDYQRLTLIENAKEQSVQAFEFVQSIIENNLPEGQTRGDAIAQALQDGIIDNQTAMSLYDQVYQEERTMAAARVEYNLAIGETGGLSNREYIQQQFSQGNITEGEYQTLMVREEQAELERNTTDFLVNLSRGNYPDGMTRDEYLTYGYSEGFISSDQFLTLNIQESDSNFGETVIDAVESEDPGTVIENSDLTDEEKEIAIQTAYQENYKTVAETVNAAFVDRANTVLTDAQGNIIRSDDQFADVLAYIEANRTKIGDVYADRLINQIETRKEDLRIQTEMNFNFIASPGDEKTVGVSGEAIDNPYYVPALEGFDFTTIETGVPNDEAITSDSKLIYFSVGQGDTGTQYISAGLDVSEDPYFGEDGFDTLDRLKEKHTGSLVSGSVYAGDNPGEFFLYENGNFYRLIEAQSFNAQAYTNEEMKTWIAADNPIDANYMSIFSTEKFDRWTSPDGTRYYETNTKPSGETKTAVEELFKTIHGAYSSSNDRPVVVLYQGKYYNRDKNGEISEMKKVD